MKKIFVISLVAGFILITGCAARLSENEKNSDYFNTLYRGRNYQIKLLFLTNNKRLLKIKN